MTNFKHLLIKTEQTYVGWKLGETGFQDLISECCHLMIEVIKTYQFMDHNISISNRERKYKFHQENMRQKSARNRRKSGRSKCPLEWQLFGDSKVISFIIIHSMPWSGIKHTFNTFVLWESLKIFDPNYLMEVVKLTAQS